MTNYPRVIQCNTTAQVMCTISAQRAIKMILSGSAYSIADTDEVMRSQKLSIPVPSIIMMTSYVDEWAINESLQRKVEKVKSLRGEDGGSRIKRKILDRDKHTCAYCGNYGDTIDHIVPQSRGGTWAWDNVITACSTCNGLKSDKSLTELGWSLLFNPRPLDDDPYASEQKKVFAALGY